MFKYLLVCGLVFLGSCSSDKKIIETKEYYFPYENFANSVIYTYHTPDGNQVWQMHFDPKSRIFTSDIILSSEKSSEVTNEIMSDDGTRFVEYTVVKHDVFYEASLVDKDVLKWKMTMDDVCVWKIVIPNEHGDIETIKKSRQIKSVGETYSFDGIDYDAIVFKDDYEQTIRDNNYNKLFSRDFVQYTTYAKGIGIVRSLRVFENGDEYETYLIDIDSSDNKHLR